MSEPVDSPPNVGSADVPAAAHPSDSLPTLINALPQVEDIATFVEKEFPFPEPDYNADQEQHFHIGLAPSYLNITSESIMMMDDALKVAIASTTRRLVQLPIKGRSWEQILKTMLENPLLKRIDSGVDRYETLLKPSRLHFFRFDRTPDAAVVKEVEEWFKALVKDPDVLKETRININVMANIVARTGAAITACQDLVHKAGSESRVVLDIGVLRYPDINAPYFKLYYIKVRAWAQYKSVGIVQEDRNGISGEYHSYNFFPCREIIHAMSPSVQATAISEAEKLFPPARTPERKLERTQSIAVN